MPSIDSGVFVKFLESLAAQGFLDNFAKQFDKADFPLRRNGPGGVLQEFLTITFCGDSTKNVLTYSVKEYYWKKVVSPQGQEGDTRLFEEDSFEVIHSHMPAIRICSTGTELSPPGGLWYYISDLDSGGLV